MLRRLVACTAVRRPHNFSWRTVAVAAASSSSSSSSNSDNVCNAVDNILFNTQQAREVQQRFTLCALVQNEPGVLSRVSGLLAGRGFNIDSLVVSATDNAQLSRMTVVLRGQKHVVQQARRQMEDLVPVWAVIDCSLKQVIERDFLLVKVTTCPIASAAGTAAASAAGTAAASAGFDAGAQHQQHQDDVARLSVSADAMSRRSAITELARLFSARVVDIGTYHMVVELGAKASRIDAFLELLRPFGIIESSRSGVMVMARTPVCGLTQRTDQGGGVGDDAVAVSDENLPPS